MKGVKKVFVLLILPSFLGTSCVKEEDDLEVGASCIEQKKCSISDGETITSTIAKAEGFVYRFKAPSQPGVLKLTLTPEDGDLTIDVKGINVKRGMSVDNGETKHLYVGPLKEGEMYFVNLKVREVFGNLANFELKATYITKDIYEHNETFAKAKRIQLNETIIAQILPKDDSDFFKVNISETGEYEIRVNEVPEGLKRMFVDVFKSKSYSSRLKRASTTTGQELLLSTDVIEKGVYYIEVDGDKSNNGYLESLNGESETPYKLTITKK